MLFQFLSFLLIFHYIHIPIASGTEEDPRFFKCDYTSNYTVGSIFSTNLVIALSTLQNHTASTGFNTTLISTENSTQPEPVTALALCRGTLTPSECKTCIVFAVSSIRRVCPNQKAAHVWHDNCMIRYSSNNFINKMDPLPASSIVDNRDVPDPTTDKITVRLLMQNLSVIAGTSDKRYAVAKAEVSGNIPMYGYVDCTRDIDGESCRKCLFSSISYMNDCCFGKRYGWLVTPTCNVQFNMDSVHLDWETAPDIRTLLLADAPPPPYVNMESVTRSTVIWMIIGVVLGGLVGAVIFIVGLLWIIKRRRGASSVGEDVHDVIKKEGFEMKSFLFDLDVLVAATNNFSDQNKLGRGGFGTVYKGRMAHGGEIAVKKLAADSLQGQVEFANEVKVLLKMQHRNLVQLLGCCVQGNERILVYEYLPNRSLDKYIFDKSKSAVLDWVKRLNIIMGVARGLLYLHQDSLLRIIHRDIKASNILLDEHMNPKISDFGTAKLFTDEQTYFTRQIVGTYGYMAPEYAIQGRLSVKSDVFSFGVLMLEVISGRKNFDLQFEEDKQELLKLAWRLEQEGRLLELVDARIGSFPGEIALRCMRIALLCIQDSIQDRPTIYSTLSMLSNSSLTIPLAGRPGYHGDKDNKVGPGSGDNISITMSLTNGR